MGENICKGIYLVRVNCHTKNLHNSTAKETTDNMGTQPSEWEKIFAKEVIDEELISKIHK